MADIKTSFVAALVAVFLTAAAFQQVLTDPVDASYPVAAQIA
jgi:hypothetical protein